MRRGCGANQEAIANVTRTRCDRRAMETGRVQGRYGLSRCDSLEDNEQSLAEKLVESRSRRTGGKGPVSYLCGAMRCQATGRAMCR
jgi:hypothetical protein